MSRGLGHVQRGILAVLADGALSAPEVARALMVSEGSTRRALRRLAQAGEVECLGYQRGGAQRWGLPGIGADLSYLWPPDSVERLTALMGARFTRSFRRDLVAAL